MRRLSGTDSLFLAGETPTWSQHVAGLTILDPTRVADFGFERVSQSVASRINLVPKLMWKLKDVPLGLGRSVWIDDPDFDLRRHVHRLSVPAPGDPRALADAVAPVLGRQLDRRYPLWELWYVDGLVNDRAAVLMKMHHCMLDGGAGSVLASLLLDFEPDPPPRTDVPSEIEHEGPPNETLLMLGSIASNLTAPLRVTQYLGRMARRGVDLVNHVASGRASPDMGATIGAPKTSFNAPIGPRRALSFSSVSLADVKALAAHHEAKVNDVALALCSSAIRSYLDERGESVDRELTAGVPVSLRAAGDASLDNQLSYLTVPIGSHLDDPIARLEHIATQTRAAKEVHRTLRNNPVGSIADLAPPFVLGAALRLAYQTHVLSYVPGMMNVIVSNVPGPPMALYLGGAELTGIFSASVLLDCMGLNVTLFTFGDRVDFGLHVDPDLIDDPWSLAEAIPAALDEMLRASGLGAARVVADPFGLSSDPGPPVADDTVARERVGSS